mgnify:CR=1 FL=1
MTTRILTGYVARTTDKAMAFLANATDTKALWLPLSKITSCVENDTRSVAVQLEGEKIQRNALPVTLEVDVAFLQRIGV